MAAFKVYLVMPLKPIDNFSLLPLFYFAFAKQISQMKSYVFFPRNFYRNTLLYGPQLNVAVSPCNRHIVASFKMLLLILRNWISRRNLSRLYWHAAIRNIVEIGGLVQKVNWGNSQHGDRF